MLGSRVQSPVVAFFWPKERAKKTWQASMAQWQSTSFVMMGSRVRSPVEALFRWLQRWLFGLVAWFSLWVREVPGSIPGTALFLNSKKWISSLSQVVTAIASKAIGVTLAGSNPADCDFFVFLGKKGVESRSWRERNGMDVWNIHFDFSWFFFRKKRNQDWVKYQLPRATPTNKRDVFFTKTGPKNQKETTTESRMVCWRNG